MPFDAMPPQEAEDIVKLRVARDGVGAGWDTGHLGLNDDQRHCAIGWLLVAADWDTAEATRLAVKYVYPALPPTAQHAGRLESIYNYNDRGDKQRILKLFNAAIALAEKVHARQ